MIDYTLAIATVDGRRARHLGILANEKYKHAVAITIDGNEYCFEYSDEGCRVGFGYESHQLVNTTEVKK